MNVDAALTEVPVNILPLLDDADFKTIEAAVVYNAAGLALFWNFVTTAGAQTCTAVTPTSGGDYDWTDQGTSGMYAIEIPASGGASINNDTEGYGWFTGVATGVLPWRGPVIEFRSAVLNNSLVNGSDTLPVDLTQIDGQDTNGNNATLNLKKLNVVNNNGSAVVASSTGGNGHGIEAIGNGTGAGLRSTGGTSGAGAYLIGGGAGDGFTAIGGSSGNGMTTSGGTGSGSGLVCQSINGNGHGITATGQGSGEGLKATGGATGNGIEAIGGGTSGDGILVTAAGSGLDINAPNSDIGIDLIWDEQVDGTVTARESLRLSNSAAGAKLSGAATTTAVIRDLADTKDRITATVDSNGNRTAVTRDLS